jgi:hypothetical protein
MSFFSSTFMTIFFSEPKHVKQQTLCKRTTPACFFQGEEPFIFPGVPALYFVRRIWLGFLCFLTSRNGTPWNPSGNCHQGTKLPREPACLPAWFSLSDDAGGGPNLTLPKRKKK